MADDPIARVMTRRAQFGKERQRQLDAQADADRLVAKKEREARAKADQQQREAEEADRPCREAEAARLAELVRQRAEEQAKARAEAEAQARLDEAKLGFERGGFPERHRQAIGTVVLTEAQQRARHEIAEGLGKGAIIALAGDRGCGKTQLATIACWELVVQDNTRAQYWTFADLVAAFREAEFDRHTSGSDWLRRNALVPLLVIDELGERRDTADEMHLLTRVLDLRYREMRGTLVVTNTKVEHVERDLGDSAFSRLSEDGCIIDASDWPCFRESGYRSTKPKD